MFSLGFSWIFSDSFVFFSHILLDSFGLSLIFSEYVAFCRILSDPFQIFLGSVGFSRRILLDSLELFRIFVNTLRFSGILLDLSGFSRILLNFLDSLRLFRIASDSIEPFQNLVGFFWIPCFSRRFCRILSNRLGISSDSAVFFQIFYDFFRFSCILSDFFVFLQILSNSIRFLGYFRILSNPLEFFRVFSCYLSVFLEFSRILSSFFSYSRGFF